MTFDYQGTPTSTTPFDSKYKCVKNYLRTAYQFKYEADKGMDQWQLPEQTERRGRGDCEDKAIWLYAKLLKDGFNNVRLVIGRQKEGDQTLHAWVAWYEQGKVYILDPTSENLIWEICKYPKGYYKPYYSFYWGKAWDHLLKHLYSS